ncbi:DNA replication complex subunit Gins51 [Halosimplex salinum]|uniref:DNA replication complex subunit Gins51 n=1 Tax=Halosimplex salinum TaxID=1710538 RepID=UPI000F45F2E8|nr:DNA replication complex GINS family protein [Halosimplex salinum]
MDLDELRSVQSRERQTDSLQQLRESFYQDAGDYIQQLHRERERAAEEADDPWDAPEVNRLSDDINTAEQTIEAIYERRVGKIVKMASLAAADMPTEDEGLTEEERALFDTLVEAIETNRARVEAVVEGENPAAAAADVASDAPSAEETGAPDASTDSADAPLGPSDFQDDETEPTPAADGSAAEAAPGDQSDGSGVDAADLMGDGAADDSDSSESDDDRHHPPDESADPSPKADGGAAVADSGAPAGPPSDADGSAADDEGGADAEPSVERATVKITSDVGEIFGVDQRAYDLTAEDVVTLPEANAGPLVERDAAERLD